VSGRSIIVVDADEPVANAWEKFIQNNILSLPVQKEGKAIGFLDIIDILSFLLKDDRVDDKKRIKKFENAKCAEVSNHSERDTFLRVYKTADMWTACNVMVDFGKLHRIPIIHETGDLVGLVSQTDVLKWIQPYIEESEIGNRTILETGLGLDKSVIKIDKGKTTREAFKLILEHNISGIAVTGVFEELYGNISGTDFKIVFETNATDFELLDLTIEEFMKRIPPNPIFGYNPIFVTPQDSLKVLVRKFVDPGVHRIFVVHNVMKICGIISMIDFIKFLLQEASPQVPVNNL